MNMHIDKKFLPENQKDYSYFTTVFQSFEQDAFIEFTKLPQIKNSYWYYSQYPKSELVLRHYKKETTLCRINSKEEIGTHILNGLNIDISYFKEYRIGFDMVSLHRSFCMYDYDNNIEWYVLKNYPQTTLDKKLSKLPDFTPRILTNHEILSFGAMSRRIMDYQDKGYKFTIHTNINNTRILNAYKSDKGLIEIKFLKVFR